MKTQKVITLGLLTAFLLAACQPQAVAPAPADQKAAAPTEAPKAAEAPAAGGDKITLKVWGHQAPAFNEADKAMFAAFMKENPNVEIKYETFPWDVFIQTLQTSMPAGTTADVIHLPGGYTCNYGLGGQLLEVPPDVMSLAQAKETFFAAPLGGQTCNGKLFGLPSEYNLEYGGAYVNQAVFEKAGVAYPPDWKSWDDLIATTKKLVTMDGANMTKAGLHYTNNDQLYTCFLSGILQQGGASEFRIYSRIALPQMGAPLASLGIFTFMATWNDYLWPLVVITTTENRTLPLLLTWYDTQHSSNHALSLTGGLFILAPVILIYIFLQRWIVDSATQSAFK